MLRDLILLAVAFVFALSGPALAAGDAVRVEGGLISGSVVDGVRSYKGIPFAAPPAGELRWKAPQPVGAWEGVRECDDFGPDCPQAPYPATSLYYSPPRKQSEDCLRLNVWTAASASEKRPEYDRETEPYLDFGDTVQLRNHILKAQLDFIERFQKR